MDATTTKAPDTQAQKIAAYTIDGITHDLTIRAQGGVLRVAWGDREGTQLAISDSVGRVTRLTPTGLNALTVELHNGAEWQEMGELQGPAENDICTNCEGSGDVRAYTGMDDHRPCDYCGGKGTREAELIGREADQQAAAQEAAWAAEEADYLARNGELTDDDIDAGVAHAEALAEAPRHEVDYRAR